MWDASDEALLAGYATGDPDAATGFIRRFQHRVFGLAMLLTRNRDAADEVAQDAMVRAWRYGDSYDPRRGSVLGWLLAIVRNVALDYHRVNGRRPEDPRPDPGFEPRILERISRAASHDGAPDGPPRRRPHRLRVALAAAAVVIAVLSASVATVAQRARGAVAATMVDGRGDRVGRVSLLADHGTAVEMDLPGWDRLVSQYGGHAGAGYLLELTLDDGSRTRVPLPPGHASTWRVTTPIGRSRIAAVAIADQHGRPWCRTQFT